MSYSREILTLQFGNYANYIGTHWWNIQESGFKYDLSAEPSEIDHDILYREGKNYKGEVTYTPRMLLVDFKGVLKHQSLEGDLYEPKPNINEENSINEIKKSIQWYPNEIEVVKTEPAVKPDYINDLENPSNSEMTMDETEKSYDFTKTVNTWTDFLYTRYHPRTVNVLNNFEYSESHNPFDTFTSGKQTWNDDNFCDDFSDKIRQYIEECDMCQGFQTIFDCVDGFSGLTMECLESIREDYSYPILAFPIIPPKVLDFRNSDSPMSDSIRLINIAMTYCNLINNSSLFIPLSTMSKGWRSIQKSRTFPMINFDSENFYETSSIIATYLDTISLRYRMKNAIGSCFLPGFCSDLNNYGRTMAGGALGLPFNMNTTEDFIDCLDRQINDNLFTELSPNTEIGTDRVIQSLCIRGIPKTRLKRPLNKAKEQMKKAAYRCESVSEMLQLYFQCKNYNSLSHVSSITQPMTIRTPYPSGIFNNNLNFEGFVNEFQTSEPQTILSIPTIAVAQSSDKLSDTLECLHREVGRIKIQKIHRFTESGLEIDEFKEMLNSLLEFKDNYDDNFDL